MARPRKKQNGADTELVDFLSEHTSGEERVAHEREPLGFEMPSTAGLEAAGDDAFHPISQQYFAAHFEEDEAAGHVPEEVVQPLAAHEGYALNPDEHRRRRTFVYTTAIVVAVVVGGAWFSALGSAIARDAKTAAQEGAPSFTELQANIGSQFADFARELQPQESAPPSADAPPAPLETLIDLRTQLMEAAEREAATSTQPGL